MLGTKKAGHLGALPPFTVFFRSGGENLKSPLGRWGRGCSEGEGQKSAALLQRNNSVPPGNSGRGGRGVLQPQTIF